jgi:hypothetical protein
MLCRNNNENDNYNSYYYYYSLLAQQLYKTTLYRTQIQRGKKKGLIHITKEHETNQIIDN